MKNVLISGANGFLGSALAERLLQDKNITVIALVKDKNFKSRRDILDRCSVVYCDLRDADAVRYAVSKYEIDNIFHLGAITILKQATADPTTCFNVNVMGTLNILEAARTCGHVEKVVVSTSDKAYGNHEVLPYKEDFALLASDPYSTSKSCQDLLSQSYAYTYGLDVSILRSGNIFGPGDLNKSRIIPGSILRVLNGEQPIIYEGVGHYKREFMFIDDVVDAFLCVRERGVKGEAYNIGGSGWASIFETVDIVIDEMKTDIRPLVLPKDFIEIKEQFLDSSKIERLGWKCKHSLREGIRKCIPWYAAYNNDPDKFYFAH